MPKKEITTVRSGLYSSHSPGLSRFADGTETGSYFTPIACMSRAYERVGWEWKATSIDTTSIAAPMIMPCYRPSVWDKGITPLMRRLHCGKKAGAVMMSVTCDERPSAQMLQIARYPSEPI